MNINFNEAFENHLDKLEKDGFIQKLIEENIENSIKKAVSEAFNGYEIRRNIEEKIKKEIDSTGYNSFIVNKINNLLQTIKENDLNIKVEEMMNKFLKPEESEIKLSKLLEEYRESLMENEQYEYGDNFGLIIDKEFKYTTYIYVDEKIDKGYGYRDKSKYQYKYQIQVDASTGEIKNLKIDDVDTKNILRFGLLDNFEGKLVRAYFNKTKLNIDVDEDYVDTSLYEEY
jgi:hypothetical protein